MKIYITEPIIIFSYDPPRKYQYFYVGPAKTISYVGAKEDEIISIRFPVEIELRNYYKMNKGYWLSLDEDIGSCIETTILIKDFNRLISNGTIIETAE